MERNRGTQPIKGLLDELGLSAQDLVKASTEQITHKMVGRAIKGRLLTPRVQGKILRALNLASHREFGLKDLFDY